MPRYRSKYEYDGAPARESHDRTCGTVDPETGVRCTLQLHGSMDSEGRTAHESWKGRQMVARWRA